MSTPYPLKGERPPPVFDHPLNEGDKRQAIAAVSVQPIPASKVPKALTNIVPLSEGVHEGRGRPSGEAPEPLPLHRKLYNPRLQPTANELRRRMTKAEACLWKYVLRAGRMKGYTFNRQRPVLRYVADFMCKSLRLIIEIDGSSHNSPEALMHDAFRQRELEGCGFSVIRFTNAQVLCALDSVRGAIEDKVFKLETRNILTGRKRVVQSCV